MIQRPTAAAAAAAAPERQFPTIRTTVSPRIIAFLFLFTTSSNLFRFPGCHGYLWTLPLQPRWHRSITSSTMKSTTKCRSDSTTTPAVVGSQPSRSRSQSISSTTAMRSSRESPPPPEPAAGDSTSTYRQITDPSATTMITVTVSYEGQSCDIQVHTQDESILAALERQSEHVRQHLHGLPNLPSDCRRGNCLTCAAKLVVVPPPQQQQQQQQQNSNSDNPILFQDDGLSQPISNLVTSRGYVLTCSTYLQAVVDSNKDNNNNNHQNDYTTNTSTTTPRLHLLLGQHDELWNVVHSSPGRFTTEETQLAARSAMAKVIRQYDERNRHQWMEATKRALQPPPTP